MPFQEAEYIWLDEKFVKWSEAKVPILTHGLHYGTGVFEGLRAYPSDHNLLVFRLEDHIKRLMNSAKIYYMNVQYSTKELVNAVIETLKINKIKTSAYIRPIIFVGYGGIGLNWTGFPIQSAIAAFPYGKYFDKPELKVGVSSWRRISDQSTPPQAKATGNYINSVLAKLDALRNGYDDAILLDQRGFVSEGTGENIFMVKDGKMYTPSAASSILEGITRDSVMQLSKDLEVEVVERDISRTELYTADEVFFTGTAAEVIAIVEIDRRTIGNGSMGKTTKRVRDAYLKAVVGEDKRHKDWATPIY